MSAAGTRMCEGLRPTLIVFPLITAALIYWVCITMVEIRLHHPCPERCWCYKDTGVHLLDCSDAGLQNIPKNTLGELRILKLDGNNYNVLRKDMFQNKAYTHIDELSFGGCNVSFIEAGAFDHISVRLLLALEENNITDIPPGVFHNLKTLKGLEMASNNIEGIRSKAFKGLESLGLLTLKNNSIRYFETDAFWGLSNLLGIDLSHNKIIHLQSDLFSKMRRLQYLDLSGNMIDIPNHTEFLKSYTIRFILLNSCNITQLYDNTFRNMTSLQGIELESNRLTYVNPNTFSMLPILSGVLLHNNPLICDCNLKETYNWFVEHNIHTGGFVPRCNEPSEVKGLWWGVVGRGECDDMVIKYNEDDNFDIYKFNKSMDEDDTNVINKNVEKYLYVVIFILWIFAAVGNVVIIVIIVCKKEFRTIPNIYILNLAIADFMTLIAFSPLYKSSTLLANHSFCRFVRYQERLSYGVTAYTIAILSIQRYEVIVRPFLSRMRNLNPRRKVALYISSIWILASLFTLISMNCKEIFVNGKCDCLEGKILQQVVIFQLVVYCILPLCVIATMYILTASHLTRSKETASEEIPQHQRRAKSRATTVKTILSLTLVFLITTVPFLSFKIHLAWASENEPIFYYWQAIRSCLILSKACFNPMALFYANISFRKFLKSFLCGRCKKVGLSTQSPEPSIQVTTTNL